MLSSNGIRSSITDSYSSRQPQLRSSQSYNSSMQFEEQKTNQPQMINGLNATRAWGDSIFNTAYATKPLDSAQSNTHNLRPDINNFEPRIGSASLVQNSQAELNPWTRRGSLSHFKLDQPVTNTLSPALITPSPKSFGQLTAPQWDLPFTSLRPSHPIGAKSQKLQPNESGNVFGAAAARNTNSFAARVEEMKEHAARAEEMNEHAARSHEAMDFPWLTKTSISPTESQNDSSGYRLSTSAGASRKGSLPVSRHGYASLLTPNNDILGRRPSYQENLSLISSLRAFSLTPVSHAENNAPLARPSLSTTKSASFRRPSTQFKTSLWPESYSQELPNHGSYKAAYRANPSFDLSPMDGYSNTQADQYPGSNFSSTGYELRQNGFSSSNSPAMQFANMSYSQNQIRDHWDPSVSPFAMATGNEYTTGCQSEQQQYYLQNQNQTMAAQSHIQCVSQAGPYAYYGMPPAATMANSTQMIAASTMPSHSSTYKGTQAYSKGIQSHKLRDFHANSNRGKRYELREVFGHVTEFAGDQQGSRFLQTKLETANSDEKATLFAEIMPNARQLMQDIYGNYVIQKLFEHGDQTQKRLLANTLRGHVPALSMQPYGCRVVQKALDHILTDQQAELISELNADNRVTKCLRDQHGNHVIQKAIEVVPSQNIQFIYEALYGQIVYYSTHTFGCRVVQRMLEKQDEVLKRTVLLELSNCNPELIMDSFGNYVAQHVIKHGDDINRNRMIGLVLENVKIFARHKFASNVVEKCIFYGTLHQKLQILNHVMGANIPEAEREGLIEYVKCAYGNYVIQSLLENLPYNHGQELCKALIPEVQKAKRTTPKKTIEGIEEKMARFSSSPGSSRPSSMHSNGMASTPTSITSSAATSIGLCLHDIADKKTCLLSFAASPVESQFKHTAINNFTYT